MSTDGGRAYRDDFEKRWRDIGFDWSSGQEARDRRREESYGCSHARAFTKWCDRTFSDVYNKPTADMLPQAFALLLHEFVSRTRALPRACARKSPFRSHMCVYEVFMMEYEYLKDVEDSNILSGYSNPKAHTKPKRRDFFEEMD